jgi:GAF domain-containing protein
MSTAPPDVIRKGRLLQWLIFMMVGISLFRFFLDVLGIVSRPTSSNFLLYFFQFTGTLIFGGACLLLIRWGRVVEAAHVFAITLIITFSLLLLTEFQGVTGLPYLMLIPVVAIAALDRIRVSVVYAAVVILIIGIYTAVSPTYTPLDYSFFVLVTVGLCLTTWVTGRDLQESVAQAQILASESQQKTELLQQRARQLQRSAQISQHTGALSDLNQLLRETVRVVQAEFEFYQVSVFLLAEGTKELILREAAGQQTLPQTDQPHRLALDERSIIGWTAVNQEARIADDVTVDPYYLAEPLLPETRSEMALPLIARDEVLGVLDVQSRQVNAFQEEDVAILQIVANQLAVNIDNVRLFAQTEAALQEAQALYQFNTMLATSLDVGEIYRRAARAMTLELQACRCLILAWQREEGAVVVQVGFEQGIGPEKQAGFFWDTAVYSLAQFSSTATTLERLKAAIYHQNAQPATPEQQLLTTYQAATLLEIPMIRGTEATGLVWLFRNESQPAFQPAEIQLAQAMANQTAVALSNAQLSSDAHVRVAQLSTINRMSVILSHAPTLKAIFDGARREIMALIPASGMSISLLTKDGRHLNWLYGYEFGHEVDLSAIPPLPITEGFSGHVIRTREMLHVDRNDVELVQKLQSFVVGEEQATWLGLPMIVSGELIGVLAVENEESFEAREVELLKTIVGPLASAIRNLIQLAELQTALEAQSKQRLQLQTAAEVAAVTTGVLDLEELVQAAVNLIKERFLLYYVGLFLVDFEKHEAVLVAGTGEAGRIQLQEGRRLPVGGKSLIGGVTADSQPRIIQDVFQNEEWLSNPYLPRTRSELALPLRVHGRVIGALTAQSEQLGLFTPELVQVLQTLSDQLATAVENARLFALTESSLAESARLYETSRLINEATTPNEIYQALVAFARDSDLVELAQIFAPDPASPDYLISPAFWSKLGVAHNPQDRFSRDRFQATNRLETTQVFRIENGPNDPGLDPHTRALFTRNGVRSATLVPIFTEQTWLGTLALDRVAPIPLTDQELQPFITLADQAAVILANQQLLRQTEALYRIGRMLNQAIARDDALDIAAREVSAYIGAVQCRVVLYDYQEEYGFVATEDAAYQDIASIRLPLAGDFIFERMRQQRAPILLVEGDETIPAEVMERHVWQFGSKASLLIPASSQQELIGFLAIDSRRGARPFTPSNLIFAQTVVDQLVTELENLKLFDEAFKRAQELIKLNQIQTNIAHYLNESELVRAVYQQIGELLDNSIFTVARYNAEANEYQTILYMVEGIEIQQSGRLLLPEEPLYHFLHQDQHRLIDQTDPLTIAEARDLNRIPQAGLWIPMQREGETAGLMSVQSHAPHAYDEHDIQLLRSIATQTNLAIANSELFARIQAHNEELMQLDQLKNQFLANMSHELRTPLNSIIGFSRVILKGIDGPITTEQQEDLTSIYNNGQHLLNLINEILDMAKIEAGKMTLSFEEVDLAQTAEAVRATVRGLVDSNHVELLWDVTADLPPIQADPIRIRQILLNLLSNAAKYTPAGQIHLKIEPEHEGVHIQVSDTGIGIAREDFDKIFVAFEQADSSTTRAVGGTGLGLPITKWLVEMHQGQIYFESELNKGSSFHVILPIQMRN